MILSTKKKIFNIIEIVQKNILQNKIIILAIIYNWIIDLVKKLIIIIIK
jgi:hypothetical protein